MLAVAVLFAAIISMAPSCRQERYYEDENYTDIQPPQDVIPPPWAPPYANVTVVRYYYFPDYYIYYDVWLGQYVYWDGFGWVFAVSYPVFISPFNPWGAYIVVLNYNVYHPWVNHTYYIEHYPQYYYTNNYYGHRDNSIIRAYDENARDPVYVPRDSKQGQASMKHMEQRNAKNTVKQPTGKTSQQAHENKSEQQRFPEQKKQQPLREKQQPDLRKKQQQLPDMRQKQQQRQQNQQMKREAPAQHQQQQQPMKQQNAPIQRQSPGGGGKPHKGGGK